ncbi:MAG: hypothetical protein KDE58_18640, partial [Caldilineaceae bacterium]|nr:hypothetical protein [Caldilineaceae bacterium]
VLPLTFADSITTWRLTASASSRKGLLGGTTVPLRVFQDFFVAPQLPAQLTLGDEVQAPIQIYNYLDRPQQIQLDIAPAAWFSSTEKLATTVTVAANDVTVVYVPLRITGVGDDHFEVSATGEQTSDRVQRPVQVLYNGEAQTLITSGRLASSLTVPLTLPVEAITGTRQVTLRLYPNTLSQVRQGLDGLLRRPSDNGMDIVTQNFANSLLLALLQQSGVPATDPQYSQAERLSRQGYQRLLAYESVTEPGGFSFDNYQPARPWLSAYLLWQLTEMQKFTHVDSQLIMRITNYLYNQQLPDGSWPADLMRYYGPWRPRQARLATTAYIAWMMAESGNPNYAAIGYLRQATSDEMADPYVEALVINALLTDPDAQGQAVTMLTQLAEQRQNDQGLSYWTTTLTTFQAGWGANADMETTALIVYALLQSGEQPDLAQSALDHLLSRRDPDGAFATPQLTVLTLKALLLAAAHEEVGQSATITIQLDEQPPHQLVLNGTEGEPKGITLTGLLPTATLQVTVQGELLAPYQLIRDYVMPWTAVAAVSAATPDQPVAITTTYDRSTVALHEVITMQTMITVTSETGSDRRPEAWVATLGLPPGFTPLPADLAALTAMRIVSSYEVSPNQLRLYLTRLYPGRSYALTLRLQANTPGYLQVLPSQLAEQYGNGERAVDMPQSIEVTVP